MARPPRGYRPPMVPPGLPGLGSLVGGVLRGGGGLLGGLLGNDPLTTIGKVVNILKILR